ncbi:MAG: signal peptidase I [Erysipelotrichaceae bacterium]|nr:signal peptidase I [Erysipelotrichaceae bacterium]
MQLKKIPRRRTEIPSTDQIRAEKERLRKQRLFRKALISTISILTVVAAVAILIATLFLPVLQVSGTSMEPTLRDKDIIALAKTGDFSTGDLVGLHYEGKILLKRVIGGPGDFINIDKDGNVYVNDKKIDEPYITDKALGETDIKYPYQVPENSYFVLGDHRSISIDSRSSVIGCIPLDQIIGKVLIKIWPLGS